MKPKFFLNELRDEKILICQSSGFQIDLNCYAGLHILTNLLT
jgi:hypothetical protein